MKIQFLGTASGKPSKKRNVTSIAIILEDSSYVLIDCGEGTQRQIMNSTLKLSKIDSIYITHLHGDHIFGLHGLLCTLNDIRNTPLNIFGPTGIRKYVEYVYKNLTNYSLHVFEINEHLTPITKSKGNFEYTIEFCNVEHGRDVECFAYKITQRRSIPKIDTTKLLPIIDAHRLTIEKAGYKPAEKIISWIKEKKSIPPGIFEMKINVEDFILNESKFSIVIALDNYNCQKMITLFESCDVLIHESTYACFKTMTENEINDMTKLAKHHGHSTNLMAFKNCIDLNCKNLILTHFSNRYDVDSEEYERIIEGCYIGMDMDMDNVDKKSAITITCANDFDIFSY